MYSHDGLKDSLTNLAAPPLFYEELRRELSKVSRSQEQIRLVRLVLVPAHPESDIPRSTFVYEREILEFAQILERATRAEDVCARMGELEFLALFHSVGLSASGFITRIMESWFSKDRHLLLTSAYVHSRLAESGLELLNRLDLEPLIG
jgi:GGDEF domain-containing protein